MTKSDDYLVTRTSVQSLKFKIEKAKTLPDVVKMANNPANFVPVDDDKGGKSTE